MSFKKQIMSKASFLHQIEDIVFITIKVFFTSYSVLKITLLFGGVFSSFGWAVFSHMRH